MKTRPAIGTPVLVSRYGDGSGGSVLGRVTAHAADANMVHVVEMSSHTMHSTSMITRAVTLRQLTPLVAEPTPWRLQAAAWLRGQATAQGDGLLRAMVEQTASDEEARAGAAVWGALVALAGELEEAHRAEEERDASES